MDNLQKLFISSIEKLHIVYFRLLIGNQNKLIYLTNK
jgi:hypothetical protein